MNDMRLILAVFSIIAGLLLSGIYGNIQTYAQQSSPSSAATDSTSTISQEIRAKMCDPSNPGLKVVNTTEAHVCGIPKTVKPSLSTTPTSAVSSSTTTQQTTKPTANENVPAIPKQHQITTVGNNNNNSNAVSTRI